jgi:hypothetical protein
MAIYQDTYYLAPFAVTASGSPANITGWTLSAEFRVNVSDADPPLLTLTTENGGFVITDPANGKFQMQLTKAQTSLLPVGRVVFDIMRTDPVASPQRLCGCRAKVKQAVTRL